MDTQRKHEEQAKWHEGQARGLYDKVGHCTDPSTEAWELTNIARSWAKTDSDQEALWAHRAAAEAHRLAAEAKQDPRQTHGRRQDDRPGADGGQNDWTGEGSGKSDRRKTLGHNSDRIAKDADRRVGAYSGRRHALGRRGDDGGTKEDRSLKRFKCTKKVTVTTWVEMPEWDEAKARDFVRGDTRGGCHELHQLISDWEEPEQYPKQRKVELVEEDWQFEPTKHSVPLGPPDDQGDREMVITATLNPTFTCTKPVMVGPDPSKWDEQIQEQLMEDDLANFQEEAKWTNWTWKRV